MSYNSNSGYGFHNDNLDETHLDRIKRFLKENYEFRKNEILDQLEYKSNEMENFQIVNTYFTHSLLFQLKENRLFCKKETLNMLLN